MKFDINVGDELLVVKEAKFVHTDWWEYRIGQTFKISRIGKNDFDIERWTYREDKKEFVTDWTCDINRINTDNSLFTFIPNTIAAKILYGIK